jgi:hypothetical protein
MRTSQQENATGAIHSCFIGQSAGCAFFLADSMASLQESLIGRMVTHGHIGAVSMSERDRMDRIERKLNRIGKSVLFGIGLLLIVVAAFTETYYNQYVFGYGRAVAAAVAVVIIAVIWRARIPFRD